MVYKFLKEKHEKQEQQSDMEEKVRESEVETEKK